MENNIPPKKHRPFSPLAKIALGYVGLIAFGALFLAMPFASNTGESIGFFDAAFMSTSAVCVTGLGIVDPFTTFTFFGQLVLFLLFQFGGLGFMTMASLLFMIIGKRLSLKDRLSMAEGFNSEDLSVVSKLTKSVVIAALCIELVGAAAVFPAFFGFDNSNVGLAIWRSIFHSVAAFCNAGFDLLGGTGAVVFLQSPLFNIVTICIIFCGGIGISTILNIGEKIKKGAKLTFNTKIILSTSLILLFGGALYIFIAEFNNMATIGNLPLGDKILAALFQSTTTRSAGFNTINQSALTPGSVFMSNVLMVIGVSPASTGGGIKIPTLVVVLAGIRSAVFGKDEFHLFKHGINKKTFLKALSIIIYYVIAICVAIMIISLSDNQFTFTQILFECISALSNVGLSMSVTTGLSSVGRAVLMALMYLGRVGFLCITYAIVSSSLKSSLKYPDGKIVIG